MATFFNVAALFIMFREALEAAIIIAVLLQLMDKLKLQSLKKQVWIGALSGLGVSVLIGAVFIILFYVAGTSVFSGKGMTIFKGVVMWVACLLITLVAFHMLKFYNLERKWRRKLQNAIAEDVRADKENAARRHRYSVAITAFMATLREGIESVIFLTGVSNGDGIQSVILPGLIGLGLGLFTGWIIFRTGRSIRSLKWFFFASCFVLLLIAAGMVVNGTGLFQQAGLFGTMYPYEWRPWSNWVLWDTSACCNMYTNRFWELMRALFGYQDQPTSLQTLYYFLYWALVLVMMGYKYWTGTLTDKRRAELDAIASFNAAAAAELAAAAVAAEDGSEKGLKDPASEEAGDLEAGAFAPKAGAGGEVPHPDSAKDLCSPPGSGAASATAGSSERGSSPPPSPVRRVDSARDSEAARRAAEAPPPPV